MGATVDTKNAINVKISNPVNKNDGADVIYITAAGYTRYPFRCATPDSDLGWDEPIWGADLTRSTDFVLTNILDVDYGLVARVEISYAYMNIADYKVLCKISKERVCYVTYFNRETATWVTDQEFAFTSQSLKQLYAFGSSYFGVRDISIALVATNRDRVGLINTDFTITYNTNGGSGTVASQSAKWGENINIASSSDLSYSGKTFKEWNTQANGRGGRYLPNQSKTMWENMTLYAIWE